MSAMGWTENHPRRTSKARLFQLALEVLVEKLPQPVHENSNPRPGAQVNRLTRIRDAVVDRDTAVELHRNAARREQQERVERYLTCSSSGHAQTPVKEVPAHLIDVPQERLCRDLLVKVRGEWRGVLGLLEKQRRRMREDAA